MASPRFQIGNTINIGREPWNKGLKTGFAPWLGKKRSEEDRKKMSIAKLGKRLSPNTEFKKGIIPWNWKGDNAGLGALHAWITRKMVRRLCVSCYRKEGWARGEYK